MDAKQLQKVRRLIVEGATWRKAAKAVRLPVSTVYEQTTRRWPDLKKRPRMSKRERRNIARAIYRGASCRKLAARYNRSASTVHRLRRALLDAAAGPPAAAVVQPYRCESCGAVVSIDPCLACQLLQPNIKRFERRG